MEQITQYTKAGGFCKSCVRPGGHEKKKYYLEDILKETRADMEKELQSKPPAPTTPAQTEWKSMTLIRKLNAIDKCLSETVRPKLERDGGDCEVLEVKDLPDGTINVYIQVS